MKHAGWAEERLEERLEERSWQGEGGALDGYLHGVRLGGGSHAYSQLGLG